MIQELDIQTILPCEPLTVEEALSDPAWFEAMQKKYKALMDNNTWTLVSFSFDMKVITNKWCLESSLVLMVLLTNLMSD